MDFSDMFTVTPMSQKIELVAGEAYEGAIIVANPANATRDFGYRVGVSKYSVVGEDYQADFSTEDEHTRMADWITIENPTGTLKPNETATIKYTIKVPEDVPAGGQYAALMVGSNSSGIDSGTVTVNNVYEMASIIYATVAGETVRSGEVISNSFPGFATTLPITTSVVFKNDGNVHETARVSIEVRDAFTNNVIYPRDGEDGTLDEVVMPGTTREFVREINDLAPLGVFTVKQKVVYMGQAHAEEHTVVLCPIWFMLLVAVVVGMITGIIIRLVMRHRRRPVAV